VPAYPGCPGKEAAKRVSVCLCASHGAIGSSLKVICMVRENDAWLRSVEVSSTVALNGMLGGCVDCQSLGHGRREPLTRWRLTTTSTLADTKANTLTRMLTLTQQLQNVTAAYTDIPYFLASRKVPVCMLSTSAETACIKGDMQ